MGLIKNIDRVNSLMLVVVFYKNCYIKSLIIEF